MILQSCTRVMVKELLGTLGTNKVMQIGIIVRDIEQTAKDYAEFLGVPMPNISPTDTIEKSQATYKGEPCYATAKLAFLNVGDGIDIELIEPDDKPSTWREFLETKGEGVHHIAFGIKDTKAVTEKLEGLGMPLEQKGEYTGGRYAYFDTVDKLKLIIETLEND